MGAYVHQVLTTFPQELWKTLVPLVIAVVCGGAVGLEREHGGHPAGLRTHVLVSVGSALLMEVSISMWSMTAFGLHGNGDPGRIAAQVVSGIGFLGAGTIMRDGINIRGLTTAASLWVVAGVGLAVGAQLYLEAICATTLVVLTLKTLSEVERRYLSKNFGATLIVHVADIPGRLGALATVCGGRGANIKSVAMRQSPAEGTVEITFGLRLARGPQELAGLIADLMSTEGVISVTEEE
ncbi:MAG: MgtC/SapB family protein [Mycobacterium leprae]